MQSRRHNDPAPGRLVRSLIFLLSALLFSTALFGLLRDAEAQMMGYSLPNGAGGWNYYNQYGGGYDSSGGMLGLGLGMMNLANQNQMHQRQMAAQYGYYDRAPRYVPREAWSPEKARSNWGKTYSWE